VVVAVATAREVAREAAAAATAAIKY